MTPSRSRHGPRSLPLRALGRARLVATRAVMLALAAVAAGGWQCGSRGDAPTATARPPGPAPPTAQPVAPPRATPRPCPPQDIVITYQGACRRTAPFAAVFVWDGGACQPVGACPACCGRRCTGRDCGHEFATLADCEAAYAGCIHR